MLKALNETKALQGLVGATISAMNNDYKAATDTAQGVCSTGMKKISIKAFIKDLSYEPTTSIEQASVKIAENGKRLKALESKIKSEANTFSKLKDKQLTNIDAVISTFSNNIHASNALYDMSMDKSANVIGNIDKAIAAYDDKAEKVAAEAVRQAAIMTESGLIIAQLIANAANNPIYGIVALPQIYRAEEQIRKFVTLFNDFNNDYNYIEENSALISAQGKDISQIIMTARRKNTQVTTILEKYFQKKMQLSSRLKKKLASQAKEGYKEVEKKAESVAIEEAELD